MITLTNVHELTQATGTRKLAWDLENGRMYVWVPKRIKTYTCPEAGVEHKLYWRSHGTSPGPERNFFACEHNSVVQ